MAQLVEHILGKDEVPGSNPGSSSKKFRKHLLSEFFIQSEGLACNQRAKPAGCNLRPAQYGITR